MLAALALVGALVWAPVAEPPVGNQDGLVLSQPAVLVDPHNSPAHRALRLVHTREVTKVPTWSSEQRANAQAIVQVGRSLGASQRDILIGLMTAMQESGLRNLNYGDRDSVGLFQQRTPWGTLQQRMDPMESARMFFQGGHGAGQGGLLSVKNRDTLSLSQAAQRVQRSAFPDAYGKHESEAQDILKSLGELNSSDVTGTEQMGGATQFGADQVVQQNGDLNVFAAGVGSPTADATGQAAGIGAASAMGIEAGDEAPAMFEGMGDTTPSGGTAFEDLFPKQGTAGGSRERVGQLARQLLGTPYVFGGSDPEKGLDCSGFVQYVLKQVGVNLPRISAQQATAGRRTDVSQLQAGDLVGWNNSSRNSGADHIAIYLGNGQIIEAPRPGLGVRIRTLDDNEGDYWGVALNY